jgi:quercetin dioxygenase-like cupin family protein
LAGVLPGQAVADPASPALVWSHDLGAPGATVRFPRHASVDVYGVVLKGAVTLRGDEGGPALGAKRWVAFRAPGAGASVAASEAGARVLLAVVTAGEPLRDALATPAAGAAWKTRPAALAVVDLAASKDLAWGGGAMHARLGFQGAGQRASLGLLMASADAQVARHRHDDAWEILVALRASGTAGRAAGGGALEGSRLEDGGVVAMPRGIDHAWTPDGKKALVAVQLYVPPGPEQRFKKLAGVE